MWVRLSPDDATASWRMESHAPELRAVMDELTRRRETRGVQMRGGKKYTMVSDRVEALRQQVGDYYRIETTLVHYHPDTQMIVMRAVISDPSGAVVATGHAEEIRGATRINETSALEACETSAIGRALACLGIHGGEFASINEIEIAQGKEARIAHAKATEQLGLTIMAGTPNGLVTDTVKPGQQVFTINEGELEVQTEPVPQATSFMLGDVVPKVQTVFHPILKDIRPDVAAEVVEMIDDTPVISTAIGKRDNGWDLAEEAFLTFLPFCETSDALYSFWHSNANLIEDMKKNAEKHFNRIRDAFTGQKAAIQRKQP